MLGVVDVVAAVVDVVVGAVVDVVLEVVVLDVVVLDVVVLEVVVLDVVVLDVEVVSGGAEADTVNWATTTFFVPSGRVASTRMLWAPGARLPRSNALAAPTEPPAKS